MKINLDKYQLETYEIDHVLNIINGVYRIKYPLDKDSYSFEVRRVLKDVFKNRDYISVVECSLLLGVSRNTIYKYIKEGVVVAYRNKSKGRYIIDVNKTTTKMMEYNAL